MLILNTISSFRHLLGICLYAFFGFFMICLPAYAAPSEGMRYKTLADVMDDYMRTKTPAWLIKSIGEPDEKDTKYKGYSIWRWFTNSPKQCQESFVIENSSNRIVGWQTDCNPKTPDKNFGEISAATPIPERVIPESIRIEHRRQQKASDEARAKAAEEAKTRKATFPDWLASLIGQSEEKIFMSLGAPHKTQNLSPGKMMNFYVAKWETSSYSQADLIAWVEGWGSRVGGMTYSKQSCTYSLSFSAGKVVGYDGTDCKTYPNAIGLTIPYKTPVAPWSTY